MKVSTWASPTNGLRHAPDDEAYWATVRSSLEPMYKFTQLVNTRRGPAPQELRDRIRSLVDLSLSYELDEYEPFNTLKESGSSAETRQALAEYFGTTADQIAVTRNTMEGVAIVLNGLDLNAGDEVIATKLCYDSNLAILRQRVKRHGIVLKLVDLPFGRASDEQYLKAFSDAITPRTRLISFPHVVAFTGQVFPVAKVSALARSKGIFSFVDGAHSAGHIELRLDDLGCDAFATSLHKWMLGPRGTGFLFMRREKIANIWPIWASYSGKPADSIEKFEEVGTLFKALPATIPVAMAFNRRIGQAEKSARLRYLRDRWMKPLSTLNRVQMLTVVDAEPATGFGAFTIQGLEPKEFARQLREEFDINVLAFEIDEDRSLQGIHLSPSFTNTIEELDRFVDAAFTLIGRV